MICQENRIREIIPQTLLTCRETIRRALEKILQQRVDTCWMDAGAVVPPEWLYCRDAGYSGGTVLSGGFRVVLDAAPAEIWPVIARIGGKTNSGWTETGDEQESGTRKELRRRFRTVMPQKRTSYIPHFPRGRKG